MRGAAMDSPSHLFSLTCTARRRAKIASQRKQSYGPTDTFNEHQATFVTANSSVEEVFWPQSPHMLLTRKLCWLIVMALSEEKRRNREASTFFKSSILEISPAISKAFPTNSNRPASSCVNGHANSTPVQPCATCMCWVKCQRARNMGSVTKNLAKAFDNYVAKEGCLEDLLSNKPSGTINPVHLLQRTPEHDQERANQQNTVSHNSYPWCFILQLRRNIPWRTRGAPALDHFAARRSLKYRSAATTDLPLHRQPQHHNAQSIVKQSCDHQLFQVGPLTGSFGNLFCIWYLVFCPDCLKSSMHFTRLETWISSCPSFGFHWTFQMAKLFPRTLWRSRPVFAPMKSCSNKMRKSPARLLCHVPVHLPSSVCPAPTNDSLGPGSLVATAVVVLFFIHGMAPLSLHYTLVCSVNHFMILYFPAM